MHIQRKKELLNLCATLGEKINNLSLLNTALTHSSYAYENRNHGMTMDNERIEFLGDSVLGLIVSTFLYKNFPEMNEGEMTKIRARYVCEHALANYARKIYLGKYILLGKGELMNGGRDRNSILADTFESVIGAYYLDVGFECTRKVVLDLISDEMLNCDLADSFVDYKTQLQELVQRDADNVIKYYVVNEIGPDHNKQYDVVVKINDATYGGGLGKIKNEAEQLAAKLALEKLKK